MSSIFSSILSGSFSLGQYLLCLLFAGLCGAIAALSLGRESNSTRSFLISLVVLPIIVTTVILMVNGNVGTGIAVAGAFSLVRFRSAAGRARDISAIFMVMAAGLACAAGYVAIALLFTLKGMAGGKSLPKDEYQSLPLDLIAWLRNTADNPEYREGLRGLQLDQAHWGTLPVMLNGWQICGLTIEQITPRRLCLTPSRYI